MWKEKLKSLLRGQQTTDNFTFCRAAFAECSMAVRNPGCGWYHLYTFDAAKVDDPLYLACGEEELVLLRIGIGTFVSGAVPRGSIEWIRKILAFFRDRKKGMILRFAYDLEGKGLEHEPASIKTVQEHMQQIGSVIREFSNDVYAVQGILIGNWGEMHGSRYLTPGGFQTLVQTMLDVLDGTCPLAVRRPSQWRELTKDWNEEEKEHLTLYNDGIFGSETDLGTYGTFAMETPGQEPQSREAELAWQNTAMRGHFCGGEAVQSVDGNQNISSAEAIKDLEKMHVSYLNSTYDLRLLEQWKRENVDGISGTDAIGKRLGYRFVVENVEMHPAGEKDVWKTQVEITLKNRGFAELTEEADCYLETESGEKIQIAADPRSWNSGEKTILRQTVKLPAAPEQQRLFLALYRRRDQRPLLFANQKTESGRVLLGTYHISFSSSKVPS